MKIGISSYPSYYDMCYIETDAPEKFMKDYIQKNRNNEERSFVKMIEFIRKNNYTATVVNMDFILNDNITDFQKTNNHFKA